MERRSLRDEEGLSLVELMVSITLLGILLGALTTTMINVLDLSRNNANRTVAANLAAGAIEELRTRDFEDLADLVDEGAVSEQVVVDDREFTLTREVFWSSNLADAGQCLGAVGPADENILRITVDVTWTRNRGIPPVRSETAVSPEVTPTSSNSGTIAVQVLGPGGSGVQGVPVTLVSLTTGALAGDQLTDADGCAVFQGLARATYEASLGTPATPSISPYLWVDLDQRRSPDVVDSIGTAPRLWVNLEFRYSPSGLLSVSPRGWAGVDARLPLDVLPWFVESERSPVPFRYPSTDDPPVHLYPGFYNVGVGTCEDSDLAPRVDDRVELAAQASVTADVIMGSFRVEWSDQVETDLLAAGLDPRTITLSAIAPSDPCFGGLPEFSLPSITELEEAVYALPFADGWQIVASREGDELDRVTVNLSPDDIDNGLPIVEFDYGIAPPPTFECGGVTVVPSPPLEAIGGQTTRITPGGVPHCLHSFLDAGEADLEIIAGSGSVAYIIVGGGGGGGALHGGGGGAGGLLQGSLTVAAPSTLPVSVGSGGTAGITSAGSSGSSSSFAGQTAAGGGGGGSGISANDGLVGGSGGGAGGRTGGWSASTAGALALPAVQGNRGGASRNSVWFSGRNGGGGGGFGSVGSNATPSAAGAGGAGITLLGFELAGGGGGAGNGIPGSASSGGGAGGPSGSPGADGVTNTGGGGGGGPESQAGGRGGRGVVHVWYPLQ